MLPDTMPTIFSSRPRVEEVFDNVFRIDLCVPLILGPTNSYLIRANANSDCPRSLIIDTGADHPATKVAFDSALHELGVSWDDVDVFITHFHWDHYAGLTQIWRPSMTVYGGLGNLNGTTLPIMSAQAMLKVDRMVNERHGISDDYNPSWWVPMTITGSGTYPITVVGEGDEICAGNYRFRVLETPGHEAHHRCLYDKKAGLFASGDHVLQSQYSSAFLESDDDQLAQLLESLERLSKLDAHMVLCGHGTEGTDLSKRCKETIAHYERQLSRFMEVCETDETDPGELAYLSTHLPRRMPWENRTVFGRLTLLGQTMAYLRYLVNKGKLPDVYELTLLGR